MCKQREAGEPHRLATTTDYQEGARGVLLDRTTIKTNTRGRHYIFFTSCPSIGNASPKISVVI